jgi:hypothetical protein
MDTLLQSDSTSDRSGSSTVRTSHGTAARLAFEEAERFCGSANRTLADEAVREGLAHLAAAFEGYRPSDGLATAASGSAGDASAAD